MTEDKAVPASTAPRRSRAATRAARRLAERASLAALLVFLVVAVGFVSSPMTAPAALVLPHPTVGTPGSATGFVLGARPWPSWASPPPAPENPSGGSPRGDSGPGSYVTRVSSVPLLSTGYRGWGPQPPPAILARGAGASDQPDPIGQEVRGIYLTAYTAGEPEAFRRLCELVDSTALNAMVINIKDEGGYATYETRVEAFREAGAVNVQIHDIEGLLRVTKALGIYTIGRLVTFEDSALPRYNPELAVRRPDGSLWRDRAGHAWTDPFRPEVWDYNLALAEEAARLGFDEIQFDYVRFPTDGDTKNAIFSRPSGPNNGNRVMAITQFLTYARERLAPYGVPVSADVFGIILSTNVDTSLGQVLEDVATAVDYISPMVYPSHYGSGHFGLSMPDAEPYLTVHGALTDGLRRLGPEGKAKFRPWLQDFSLYNHYGPEQVLDQIRATHELGIKGWMLWNPSNVYTVAALRAYTVNQEAYLSGGG